MAKDDPRYTLIKALLKEGEIKTFADIFKYIPYTVAGKDIGGLNNNRMKRLIKNPGEFESKEIYKLAELIGCDTKKLLLLAGVAHHEKVTKKKAPKKRINKKSRPNQSRDQ